MKAMVLLLIIIAVKVLLTKGFSLAFILLSFLVKGKFLHKSEVEWNNYFLSLNETFILKYATVIYTLAAILSSSIVYLLFHLFKFEYPLLLTVTIFVISLLLTWYKYQKKGKNEIIQKFHELQKSL